MPPKFIRIHDLKRFRRIKGRVTPSEPDVDIHRVAMLAQIERLDIVDVDPHNHLVG